MHFRVVIMCTAALTAAAVLAPTATAATPSSAANDTCRPALAKCLAEYTSESKTNNDSSTPHPNQFRRATHETCG